MLYFKELNNHSGSINGTIFFLQASYWFEKMGKPFYKFLKPCQHFLYQTEASWAEELGFSDAQLKYVLAKTATKLKNGRTYDLLDCGLVLYWAGGNGLTFYIPNYPRMLGLEKSTSLMEKQFPHFAKWKTDFGEVEKRCFKIEFHASLKFEFTSALLQESTHSNTNQYSGQHVTASPISKNGEQVNSAEAICYPFDTPGFKNIWVEWKNYKAEAHDYHYDDRSEQAALMELGNYDEAFALQLIREALSKKWKWFHFTDTPNKYKTQLNSKNHATFTNKAGERFSSHVANVFAEYAQ